MLNSSPSGYFFPSYVFPLKFKFKSDIFKSSNKYIFYNFFYKSFFYFFFIFYFLFFFFIYMKMSKNLLAKYYQENKERLQKKSRERYQNLSKEEKEKK